MARGAAQEANEHATLGEELKSAAATLKRTVDTLAALQKTLNDDWTSLLQAPARLGSDVERARAAADQHHVSRAAVAATAAATTITAVTAAAATTTTTAATTAAASDAAGDAVSDAGGEKGLARSLSRSGKWGPAPGAAAGTPRVAPPTTVAADELYRNAYNV